MTVSPSKTLYFSVGEPSGDAHAAAVIRDLKRRGVVSVTASGGDAMQQAGAHIVQHIDRMSAIGFVEVMRTVPRHIAMLSRARRLFAADSCAVAVLVDYPGYNLKLAAAASRSRIPVLYYIAPQLWAWGAQRIRHMRRHVTHIAAILPFEAEFFARQGVPTTFVGHPLLDRPAPPSRQEARAALGLRSEDVVLGVFPGSRSVERARLHGLFCDAARRVLRDLPSVRVAVADGPGSGGRFNDDGFVTGPSSLVMAAADVGLCKSGTTTLEAALANTPMCVAYRVHPFTYRLASWLISCRYVSLVNLLLDREAVPELIQDAATPGGLANALLPLFDTEGASARDQRQALHEVRNLMGHPGAAQRVGDLILELAA